MNRVTKSHRIRLKENWVVDVKEVGSRDDRWDGLSSHAVHVPRGWSDWWKKPANGETRISYEIDRGTAIRLSSRRAPYIQREHYAPFDWLNRIWFVAKRTMIIYFRKGSLSIDQPIGFKGNVARSWMFRVDLFPWKSNRSDDENGQIRWKFHCEVIQVRKSVKLGKSPQAVSDHGVEGCEISHPATSSALMERLGNNKKGRKKRTRKERKKPRRKEGLAVSNDEWRNWRNPFHVWSNIMQP